MCVAAIGKVTEIKGTRAVCSFRGAMMEPSIVLVPKVEVGDYVVVHAGFATEIVKDFHGYHRSRVATDAYSRQLLDAIDKKCAELQGLQIRIIARVARALEWHSRGQEFDPPCLHQIH